MGKTALVTRVLSDLERNQWPHTGANIPVDGILYMSTRTAGITLERLFHDTARMVGGEQTEVLRSTWQSRHLSTSEKIDRLLSHLTNGLYVILLDNMEDLLDEERRIVDEDLRTFFERSLIGDHGARLVVTSRLPLALPRNVMQRDRQVPLEDGLPVNDGITMLRDLDPNNICGLRDAPADLLADVVKRLHRIPRALEILAGILDNDRLLRLEDLLDRFYRQDDVVNELIRQAYTQLDRGTRRVLHALAVLAVPITLSSAAIDFLLEPFTPGLDVPGIVQRLARANMIKLERSTGVIRLHPIDRDYAYGDLRETGVYSVTALELRAAEDYRGLRLPPERW
jgi:hypothetical protein